ncbi:LETM1-like protein-domain-containing protein [Paraphysoderma sedebokerense]|nr:LETM1-like protein-domain-containing protein [Paraphysoderma sedebokerense]
MHRLVYRCSVRNVSGRVCSQRPPFSINSPSPIFRYNYHSFGQIANRKPQNAADLSLKRYNPQKAQLQSSIPYRRFVSAVPEPKVVESTPAPSIPPRKDEAPKSASQKIKQLKEELKAEKEKDVSLSNTSDSTSAPSTNPTASTAPAIPKKPLLQRIKDEAIHYWHGTKLLAMEIRISSRLLFKLLRGQKLSRREHRQLRRTATDLFRLVPFLVFIIIPFMELLLPVALKLFPNMLPSTFEDKFAAEEKRRKELKVRLEMAKFLQDTISEMAILRGDRRAEAAKAFGEFFRKIRRTGEQADTESIMKLAQKFEDELTLDNLSRPQLVSMCRYMNINAFGTDNFLRYQIRQKMSQLKADDKMIQAEGVDSLTIPELQKACSERGIKIIGVSPARLRHELQQWLDLHLDHRVPSSLLILSRAFIMSEKPQFMVDKTGIEGVEVKVSQETADALQATLQSLPEPLVNEAELKVSEDEGKATYKQKLEVLQEQEEMIAEELAQEAREEEARRVAKEEEAAAAAAAPSEPMVISAEEVITDEDVRISEEQLKELGEAIKVLSSKSAAEIERAELERLRIEREEYKGDISEIQSAAPLISESPASLRLGSHLEKLLLKISTEVEKYDKDVGDKLNLIRANESGQITVADLEEVLRVIRHAVGDEEKLKKVVKKLDRDGDGLVTLEEILRLTEEIEKKEGVGVVIEGKEKDKKGDDALKEKDIVVSVKWTTNKYDLDLDPSESPTVFKNQLYSVTGVPPERQKLMLKGMVVKDEDPWSKFKTLKDGVQFLMMGTAGELLKEPVKPVVFLEDMTDKELAKVVELPAGLTNLGNSCYMNATLQCLRTVPELQTSLSHLPPTFSNDMTQNIPISLRELYSQLKNTTSAVAPLVFLTNFRAAFPQFNQMERGNIYSQQDAEEAWIQLVRCLKEKAPGVDFEGKKTEGKNVVDQFMGIELTNTMKCIEAPEEPPSVSKEPALKLTCHISNNVNYLHNGLNESMNQNLEKTSPTLNKLAQYSVNQKISRLPQYLTIHFIRFFWKQQEQIRAKITRPVKYPMDLDLWEFCTPELQEKLKPARDRVKKLEDEKLEKKRAAKIKANDPVDPMQIDSSASTSTAVIGESATNKLNEDVTKYIHPDLVHDVGCNPSGQYELCAVLTHVGRSSDSGHYIAWVRKDDGDDWYKYDDDKVTPVKEADVLKLDGGSADWHIAYMVLYRAKKLA